MTKIFDLEQQIQQCWNVTDDIDLVTKHFLDGPEWEGMDGKLCDALMNKYFAIKELYEIKFQNMWETFEDVCTEFHSYRKTVEEWDNEIEMPYPDDAIEIRNDMADAELPDGWTITVSNDSLKDLVVGPFGEQNDVPEEKE